VLVRVQASSANPADNSIAAGMLKQMGLEYEFPVILGRDYAGVVEQTGAEVTRYSVGDEVFGFLLHANPTVHDGSWTELITVPGVRVRTTWRVEEIDLKAGVELQRGTLECLSGPHAGRVVDEVHRMAAWTPECFAGAIAETPFAYRAVYDTLSRDRWEEYRGSRAAGCLLAG
jgi:hypothetical protein